MAGPSLARNRFAPPAGGSGGGVGSVVVQENGVTVVPAATQLNFVGFTVTPGGPGQADILSPGTNTYEFVYHTVTEPEVLAKQFALAVAPDNPGAVLADIVDGGNLMFGQDFFIIGTAFRWDGGYFLDGVIAPGDVVRLAYYS